MSLHYLTLSHLEELNVRLKKKAAEGTAEGNSITTNPVAEKVKKAAIGSKKMIGAHVSAAGKLLIFSLDALFINNEDRQWYFKSAFCGRKTAVIVFADEIIANAVCSKNLQCLQRYVFINCDSF